MLNESVYKANSEVNAQRKQTNMKGFLEKSCEKIEFPEIILFVI